MFSNIFPKIVPFMR